MKIKGINATWLSESDLSNLNSGEGESNFVDVKKFKKDNIEYPYVSGQAMRYYLRESMRRNLKDNEYMCLPNDKGETCGNIEECINCDLFGYMTTIKDKGADVRTSPVKVSPAIGLLPFDENSNVDFLTRKHKVGSDERNSGDIVNIEIGTNIYKSGISIDLQSVGTSEIINNGELNYDSKISYEEKQSRVSSFLNAILSISDYSKQARLLTDFTPDIIIISLQNKYNHRLQKAFKLDQEKNLNLDRIKEVLNDVNDYSEKIIIGWTSGIINNEEEVKEELENTDFIIFKENEKILTPKQAMDKVISEIYNENNEE